MPALPSSEDLQITRTEKLLADQAKLAALADAQAAGRLDATLAPVDLLALVIGAATTWFAASPAAA